jgi:subtilisin
MTERPYILLPVAGFTDKKLSRITAGTGKRISAASRNLFPSIVGVNEIELVDTIGPPSSGGPRIVSMSIDTAQGLRREATEFRLCPIRRYRPALRPLVSPKSRGLFDSVSDSVTVEVKVVDEDGTPIENATLAILTDSASMVGFRRKTRATGQVRLKFPGTSAHAERLYVYPPIGYYGRYETNVGFSVANEIVLSRIDPTAYPSALVDCGGSRSKAKGKGVTVGILDTGVDLSHHALKVSGGYNATKDGKAETDFGDIGDHGTHVAGIIAANGEDGMTGVAPQVTLRSYRVFSFPANGSRRMFADTVSIMRAIYKAIDDGCDILNLSLGGGAADFALNDAIGYASEKGCLCVIAGGNDSRGPVSYPAWYKRSIAVSAYGREGTFPPDSIEASEIADPRGHNGLFFAKFSNVGFEIDIIGPGVGVVSCAPGGGYQAMSGTSMACPAVTGVAACILSDDKSLRDSARDRSRTLALIRRLREQAIDVGLLGQFQGVGAARVP